MAITLSDYLPIKSRSDFILQSGVVTAASAPIVGMIPYGMSRIGELTSTPLLSHVGNGVAVTSMAFLAPFFISRAGVLWKPKEIPNIYQVKGMQQPVFEICGMKFTEEDLFTNVLITGTIGTGKTSTAIYPLLEQLFLTYSHEKEAFDGDPLLKLGGLTLDVKGEFYEAVLWFGHQARRNVIEDVVVIRPNVYIPVVKFQDEDTKRYFYLSAQETSKGSEIKRLFRDETDQNGQSLQIDMFTWDRERLEPFEEHLRTKVLFDVSDRKLFYCGWRWEDEKLVRVARTPGFEQLEYMTDAEGKRIYVDPPKRLRYCEVISIDNGLRYNLVNPRLSAAENAKRLTDIGKLVDGDRSGGDNAYWEKASRRHISMCIEGWRLVEKQQQITGPDIMRITSQNDECVRFKSKLTALKESISDVLSKAKKRTDKRLLGAKLRKVKDVEAYFADTWESLEPKTKSITKSVVEQMFGDFLTDSTLQESFCSPATFSFEQAVQEGKFFCFVVPPEYEALAKVMGTTLKSDFQSTMLQRPSTSRMNQTRVQLLAIDECHKYAVAGGSSGNGDENFQSLSRQSRVFNIHATQSDASLVSVIGKDKADVYLQSYGGRCWFQNSDPSTNERAAKMCGKVLKEKEEIQSGDFSAFGVLGAKETGKVKRETRISKEARFDPERFNNLDKWQTVTYNKGQKGTVAKAKLKQNAPHYYSSKDTKPKVAELLRWYIQAYAENLAFKQDVQIKNDKDVPAEEKPVGWLFDPIVPGENDGAEAVPAAVGTMVGTTAVVKPAQPAPAAAPVAAAAQPTGIPIENVDENESAKKATPPAGVPNVEKTAGPVPPVTETQDASEVLRLRERKRIELKVPKDLLDPGAQGKPESAAAPKTKETKEKASPAPQATNGMENLSPEIKTAFENGKVSMAQLRELQKFFKEPSTGIALAVQMFESIKSERIYQPQEHYIESAVNSRRAGLATDVEQLAVGPKGRAGGNPELATKGGGKLQLRDEAGNERLDFTFPRAREITDSVERVKNHAKAVDPKKEESATSDERSSVDLKKAANYHFS